MIVAFSVTPLGVGEEVGEYVADAVRVVRESGLPNRTDAMFTTVEGDWDAVMDVVKRAVAAVEERAPRVSLVLKADIRPGVSDGMTSKMETVERHLMRRLSGVGARVRSPGGPAQRGSGVCPWSGLSPGGALVVDPVSVAGGDQQARPVQGLEVRRHR